MIGLGEILTSLNILEKATKFWRYLKGQQSNQLRLIPARFVRLFEAHGIHRNQIPRFIGHGLTLKDMQNDESLLAKLDEPLLEAACEKFAVRREWLDGAEVQIHPCHDFYKHPDRFSAFISALRVKNPDSDLDGILLTPSTASDREYALLLLQETIGLIGDKPIYRFHLCHDWLYSYWKARAFLTACIAIAWKQNINVYGINLPYEEIKKLEHGEALLGWNGDGIYHFGSVHWHPEEMALEPEAYLKGIDPERNNFGIKSALEQWLQLDDQGLMNTGLGKNVREKFEEKLARLDRSMRPG